MPGSWQFLHDIRKSLYQVPIGYESIEVDSDNHTLDDDKYSNATSALITVEDEPIRYRIDGEEAASDEGHLVEDGGTIKLNSRTSIENFDVIADGVDNATIRVTYFK